ncbi:hypothetical protein CK203_044209 [Vitis vinifera]|uniref:Uncharacterized protein n=1 Tax=Vitis vinifera TaxID=29760 RepID=A0A438I2K7_VITVI|nr:hypothetical protein CK203_044209 [Vitis vinifera]
MEDSHIISIIYLTDTGLEILGLRRSSRQRELFVALSLGSVSIVIDIIFGVRLFMFRASSGPWLMGSLYMLHFIYEGMSFDHWVFEPSFLSFLSPYHLGLRYVPCLKTTLRPWDQMSSSAASTWTVVFGLPGLFMDPHGLARSSLTGCSLRRGHDRLPYGAPEIHPARSALLDTWMSSCLSIWEVTCAMMDDFMTFVLRTYRALDAILGHIPFWRIFIDLRRALGGDRSLTYPLQFPSLDRDILYSPHWTIIPELFIDMSSQRSVIRDS